MLGAISVRGPRDDTGSCCARRRQPPPVNDRPDNPAVSGRAPTVLGDFELLQEIGRGGMGTVYRSWQRSLKRTVAVKVLGRQVSASSTAVVRFQREAQAAAKLNHEHIVPIFALGEQDGVYYYAMELIDGPGLNTIILRARAGSDATPSDLAETVALSGPEPGAGATEGQQQDARAAPNSSGVMPAEPCATEEHFSEVAAHIRSIADALEYAHQNGVIHRDIKPHNLIMGSDGKLMVSDFGLARLLEQPGVTMTGEMIGSPLYMSPEQINGGPNAVDRRADVYSLGATMYEWLALSPPYPGDSREQVISRILTSEPCRLSVHNPLVPVDLETICLKAIERDPDRRYATAGEFRDDLARFLQKRPIKARRAGPSTRFRRFVGRHPVASLGALATMVAISLGVALVNTGRKVKDQTAAAAEVRQENEMLLDLLDKLPLEKLIIGAPLKVAGAAVPFLQGVVGGDADAEGADPLSAGSPVGIARRAARDLYEALVPGGWAGQIPGGENDTAALLGRAMSLSLWQTDPEEALRLVTTYLGQRPNQVQALQYRVALLGRLGQFPAMLADAESLVRLQPDGTNAYLWRGLTHILLGEPGAGRLDLARARKLPGASYWVEVLMGLALGQAERDIEAVLTLDEVLGDNPDVTVALLARAYARSRLGDGAGAVTDLTAVIELRPDDADAIVLRGDHHFQLEDFEAAADDYFEAMELVGQTTLIQLRWVYARSQQRSLSRGQGANADPATTGAVQTAPTQPSSDASMRPAERWLRRFFPHGPSEPLDTHSLSASASGRAWWRVLFPG